MYDLALEDPESSKEHCRMIDEILIVTSSHHCAVFSSPKIFLLDISQLYNYASFYLPMIDGTGRYELSLSYFIASNMLITYSDQIKARKKVSGLAAASQWCTSIDFTNFVIRRGEYDKIPSLFTPTDHYAFEFMNNHTRIIQFA